MGLTNRQVEYRPFSSKMQGLNSDIYSSILFPHCRNNRPLAKVENVSKLVHEI
jgi:hypothetical protein